MYFTRRRYLNLNTKFSSKILGLCLEFTKCTVEKSRFTYLILPKTVESFPITELNILLKFKNLKFMPSFQQQQVVSGGHTEQQRPRTHFKTLLGLDYSY